MSIDIETYQAALDPGHPFNPLLYESPYGGLWFIALDDNMAPLDDSSIRKALAYGVDMGSIVRAVWGPTATHAKGVISSLIPCHNPNANYHPYDPGPCAAESVRVDVRFCQRNAAAAQDQPQPARHG